MKIDISLFGTFVSFSDQDPYVYFLIIQAMRQAEVIQTHVAAKVDSHFQLSAHDSVHCAKLSESPVHRPQHSKDKHPLSYPTKYTPPDQPDKGKDRYVPVHSNVAQTYSE